MVNEKFTPPARLARQALGPSERQQREPPAFVLIGKPPAAFGCESQPKDPPMRNLLIGSAAAMAAAIAPTPAAAQSYYSPYGYGYASPSYGYSSQSYGYSPQSYGYSPQSYGYSYPSYGYSYPSYSYSYPSYSYGYSRSSYAYPRYRTRSYSYPSYAYGYSYSSRHRRHHHRDWNRERY
jgi:hypothetical protein